jgi:AAT family amino acid transporter
MDETREAKTSEVNWMEIRKVKNILPQPISGIINLAIILVISQIIWYVFFSPNGYVRLYTPNLGLALVITILMVIHWGMDVFDFWPFNHRFLGHTNAIVKGLSLLIFYLLIGAFVMFIVYNNFIGRFGAIFFSGPQLLTSGGLGQYAQTARENASYAQIMMNTCIIFFTILWVTSFRYAPWERSSKFVREFSVWLMGLFLAIVAFTFLFYPHIAYQFYPAQMFMAVSPWWKEWAMTLSSLFHFGWIVPALVLLYFTTMLWEGRPFSAIKNTWWRGVVTIVSVVVAGILIMFISNSIMDWYFGTEAFEGGMMVEQPAWRWQHVAELAMFMAAAGAILHYYFDNWPTLSSLALRAIIRSIIAIAGGLFLTWLYYAFGPLFLGTVPGIAQEGDTSLCWTIMFLNLILAHAVFFDGFPMKKREI